MLGFNKKISKNRNWDFKASKILTFQFSANFSLFLSKLLLMNYEMTKNNSLYKKFCETAEKNRLEIFHLWEKSQVGPFQAKITRKTYPSIFEFACYIDAELNGESDFEIKFLLFECWIIDNSKKLARKHVFWTFHDQKFFFSK